MTTHPNKKTENWEKRMRDYFKSKNYQVSPSWIDGIIKIFKGVLSQSQVQAKREEKNKCIKEYSFDCSKLLKEERLKAKKILEGLKNWAKRNSFEEENGDVVGFAQLLSALQKEIGKLDEG